MIHPFDASFDQPRLTGPDLFDQEGHLTDDAFRLLLDGGLDDMGSLEVAEHLSFCDQCVQRYTQLLCGEETLLSPPVPMQQQVVENIHRRQQNLFLRKLGSLAVAASFALVFWVGGVFTFHNLPSTGPAGSSLAGGFPTVQEEEGWFSGLGSLWDSIQGFNFNGLYEWLYSQNGR